MRFASEEQNEARNMAITALKSNWTVEKRKERASWLKNQGLRTVYVKGVEDDKNIFLDTEKVDEAFELQESTLWEKVAQVYCKPEHEKTDVNANLMKDVVEICREHFLTHPKELDG
jgi:hypothetical protein